MCRIKHFCNYCAGTNLIAGVHSVLAGTKGFQSVIATGGTISDIEIDGVIYRIHAFTSDGTFNVTKLGTYDTVDVLVVAGGGGAGGLVFSNGKTVTTTGHFILIPRSSVVY